VPQRLEDARQSRAHLSLQVVLAQQRLNGARGLFGVVVRHVAEQVVDDVCVGNVVLQAALQSGCDGFGVEVMKGPASLAREQRRQMMMRARMWGVSMGDVELEEGDMLESVRLSELMSKADVVLVNNKVFLESLNEAIRPKFLDLKEGALVVSLKPFVSSLNARVTERNVDDISAIFDVSEHGYHSGAVSWGSGSGSYYVHRVDREGYAEIRARFESSRAASAVRSTRARR